MNRSPDLLRRLAGAAGRLPRGVFAVVVLALLASVGVGALLTADVVDAQIGAQTKRIYLPVAFRNFFREGGGPGPGPAPTPAPTTDEVPKSLFGMYGGSRQQVLVDQIAQFGAGTQRIYVQWNLLQFNQAYSDNNWLEPTELANLDAEIQRVRQAGMQPVLLIGEAPDYASERVRGPLRPGKTDTYLRFLRLLVERYRAQPYDVHHWELWPEPDAVSNLPARYAGRPEFEKRRAWGDNGADYAAMLKAVYPEIKRLDPNAKVLIGALAYDWFAEGKSPGFNAGGIFNYKFINDVIAAGGDCCFDILAFNSYASFAPDWEANTPEPNAKDVAAKAAYIRNELSKLGVNKPLMVLEAGLWSAGSEVAFRLDNGEVATLAPTVDVQAGYVTKLYARSAS
ncbi:MAG: hypothetical protein HY329_16395, partial [Chloroflexi bacterium]|nr:hypothetical protein [Chloroflexota bacterium]